MKDIPICGEARMKDIPIRGRAEVLLARMLKAGERFGSAIECLVDGRQLVIVMAVVDTAEEADAAAEEGLAAMQEAVDG